MARRGAAAHDAEMDSVAKRLARLRGAESQTALARRAGVAQSRVREIENGQTQNPSSGTLAKLAVALGVSISDLAGPETEGFAETDAAPLARDDARALVFALAPNAARPEAWRIGRDLPAFGLMAGDVAVVELGGRGPASGDLVLATVADAETGAAETQVRRFVGGVLISADGRTVDSPAQGAAVLGVIVASWRTTENG